MRTISRSIFRLEPHLRASRVRVSLKGLRRRPSQESLRKTLEAMDRHNIVLGFLSSADLAIVRDWVAAAPKRFIASPFIEKPGELSPRMPRQEYTAGRLAGMGERSDRSSWACRQTILRSQPQSVRREQWVPFLDEVIAMMYQYPQLYGDLSMITWIIPRSAFHRYVEALVRAGLGKRLMFGSDQMRWPEKIDAAIEAIQEADYLTAEQKRDIFCNNAVRFLRLDAARK